jgi:phage anti-repressor protein
MMPELTISDKESPEMTNTQFLAYVIENMKKIMFEHNIDYYNAIHIGADNTYNYTQNNNTKIDFNILINSLKKIQHTEESDYIYFHLKTRSK